MYAIVLLQISIRIKALLNAGLLLLVGMSLIERITVIIGVMSSLK